MDHLKNRGKESDDDKLFGDAKMRHKIMEAVEDMSHLLSRVYAEKSTLALVGNRYKLNTRQQRAVQGMSASETQVSKRKKSSLDSIELEGCEVVIDGFNVLIVLESLLSGAYVFQGKDGFYRDLSSVYGTYKRVQQTTRAIELVADFHVEQKIQKLHWYFDKPVSNSGRLKQIIAEMAVEKGYNWEVELVFNPDQEIVKSNSVAITSDAWILDGANTNFNLIEYVVQKRIYPNIFRLE
jgi:hypothetical protein